MTAAEDEVVEAVVVAVNPMASALRVSKNSNAQSASGHSYAQVVDQPQAYEDDAKHGDDAAHGRDDSDTPSEGGRGGEHRESGDETARRDRIESYDSDDEQMVVLRAGTLT